MQRNSTYPRPETVLGDTGDPRISTDSIIGSYIVPYNALISYEFSGYDGTEDKVYTKFIYNGDIGGSVDSTYVTTSLKRTFDNEIFRFNFLGRTSQDFMYFPVVVPLGQYAGVSGQITNIDFILESWAQSSIFDIGLSTVDITVEGYEFIQFHRVNDGRFLSILFFLKMETNLYNETFGSYWDNVPIEGNFQFRLEFDIDVEAVYITGSQLMIMYDQIIATGEDLITLNNMIVDVQNQVLTLTEAVIDISNKINSVVDYVNDSRDESDNMILGLSGYDLISLASTVFTTAGSFLLPGSAVVMRAIDGVVQAGLVLISKFNQGGLVLEDEQQIKSVNVATILSTMIKTMTYMDEFDMQTKEQLVENSLTRVKDILDEGFNDATGVATVTLLTKAFKDLTPTVSNNISKITENRFLQDVQRKSPETSVLVSYPQSDKTVKKYLITNETPRARGDEILDALFGNKKQANITPYVEELVDGEWIGAPLEVEEYFRDDVVSVVKNRVSMVNEDIFQLFMNSILRTGYRNNDVSLGPWSFTEVVVNFLTDMSLPPFLEFIKEGIITQLLN
jgi:hypothetical protein